MDEQDQLTLLRQIGQEPQLESPKKLRETTLKSALSSFTPGGRTSNQGGVSGPSDSYQIDSGSRKAYGSDEDVRCVDFESSFTESTKGCQSPRAKPLKKEGPSCQVFNGYKSVNGYYQPIRKANRDTTKRKLLDWR